MQTLSSLWKSYSWLYLRIAQGIIIVMFIVAAIMLANQDTPIQFDSISVQSRIQRTADIGPWVLSNPVPLESGTPPFYRLGALYAESVALTISKQLVPAKQHLKSIQAALPSNERIELIMDNLPKAMDRDDKRNMVYLFKSLQEELTAYAAAAGKQASLQFHWAGWLVDISLIGAMADTVVMIRLHNFLIRQARYFQIRFPTHEKQLAQLLEVLGSAPLDEHHFKAMVEVSRALQRDSSQ